MYSALTACAPRIMNRDGGSARSLSRNQTKLTHVRRERSEGGGRARVRSDFHLHN